MHDTSHPPVLDAGMLTDYEARLKALGVPLDGLARGVASEEMATTLAPLGLTLPGEARVWWGRHNGSPGDYRSKPYAPPGEKFLSLSEAVETFNEYRGIVMELVEPDVPELANPDDRWHPAWLPIRGPQLPLVVDCSVSKDAPTPLRFVSMEDSDGSRRIRARSLGEMVQWWMEAIDAGAWRWDLASAEWVVDRELLPEARRMSPLL